MDFSNAFQNVQNSVVQIICFNQNIQIATGTGVIIASGNLVLTCAHCINQNLQVAAKLSGQNTAQIGTVLYINTQADIAIIQLQQFLGRAAILRSSSNLLIGHEVFVAGFPNNINEITALSGNIAGFYPNGNFNLIRIDSSINHGNSGGPLFNTSGEVVGIVNAKHGSLSTFLDQIKQAQPTSSIVVSGIDPVKAIQNLIDEMSKNLNLGIGYAIPMDYIGGLSQFVGNAIQP